MSARGSAAVLQDSHPRGRRLSEAVRPPEDSGPVWDETFSECLNRFRERAGLSIRQLAALAWLTNPYVSRLVNWECDLLNPPIDYKRRREERHPSRDTVIRLGIALRLSVDELDELLMSAGYAPLVR